MATKLWFVSIALLISHGFAGSTVSAQRITLDPAEDESRLSEISSSVLFLQGEQKIAAFRNMNKLGPSRTVLAGPVASELPEELRELGAVKVNTEDHSMTIDEYLERQQVAGLLVIKDGKIVFETYGFGNNEDTLWISFSVTKSIVSMLVGAAIHEGYIDDVDEKVTDYLPRLKDTSYDAATLENILQMASGVEWNEDYDDPRSDVASADYATLSLYEHLGSKPRTSEPGTVFNYNTGETNLVGTLLRSAIGNNLSTYLSEKIWKPMGMHSNAEWILTEPGGGEFGGCCLNATLRDYGRLGMFALNDGVLPDGTRVLPEGWMKASTTPSKGLASYGYLWWLQPSGSYAASGIFGQGIYISPEHNLVIAIQSAREVASRRDDWLLQNALYAALEDALNE